MNTATRRQRRLGTWLRRSTATAVGLALAATGIVNGASEAQAAYDMRKGPNPTSRVTLTFDDCPKSLSSFKSVVLAAEQMDIGLVLFPTGNCITAGTIDTAFARAHGHYVFNHSISHPDLRTLSYSGIQRQLGSPGVVTSYGRPPYGAINSTVQSAYASVGMKPWLWNVDTNDWRGKSSSELVSYVVSNARAGDSVLMHMQWNGFNASTLSAMKSGLARRGIGVCRNYPGTTPTKPAQLDCNAGGGSTPTPTPSPGIPNPDRYGDLNGDGRFDLLAVDSANTLRLYPGKADMTMAASQVVGPGWGSTNWMSRTPDLNGDGISDLIARRTDGSMWLYRTRGRLAYHPGVQVGWNWSGMSKLVVMPDVNKDGYPELVGASSDGALRRYRLAPTGMSFQANIGSGWKSNITRTMTVGQINGDATPDLLAITSGGDLMAYTMSSTGRISATTKVGHGWGAFTMVYSPGDLNNDGRRDLVARKSSGDLYVYRHQGGGRWFPAARIGTHWNSDRLFA